MEIQQRISDSALTFCPSCQTDGLYRVIGLGGGFVLKGTGFYNTDYKNAGVKNAEAKSSDAKKDTQCKSTSQTCSTECAN